ncbi:hypothetical protein ACJD0Z_04980 [Flavobacteriaceae bacterium M23B6Z8]
MRQIGTYLAIFGIGSVILSFLDMNFTLLMWIDSWGETAGWIIRASMIILGAVLFFAGSSEAAAEPETVQEAEKGE